jgi:acyl-CoA thioester hydrolase
VAELCNPLEIRVYWEDIDAGGVVYYANYLKFFERARTEWLRKRGLEQGELMAREDCIFVVADVHLQYRVPARLDDLLTVTVEITEQGLASMQLLQQAWRDGTLLAVGRVRIGCVRASTLRPCRIPAQVGQLL